MKLVKETRYLEVFETEPFQAFGASGGFKPGCTCRWRLYVGFEREHDEQYRRPAVTALFTVLLPLCAGNEETYFLEWLETSRYYDAESAQLIRDEFMGVLQELHPPGSHSEPQAQQARD